MFVPFLSQSNFGNPQLCAYTVDLKTNSSFNLQVFRWGKQLTPAPFVPHLGGCSDGTSIIDWQNSPSNKAVIRGKFATLFYLRHPDVTFNLYVAKWNQVPQTMKDESVQNAYYLEQCDHRHNADAASLKVRLGGRRVLFCKHQILVNRIYQIKLRVDHNAKGLVASAIYDGHDCRSNRVPLGELRGKHSTYFSSSNIVTIFSVWNAIGMNDVVTFARYQSRTLLA